MEKKLNQDIQILIVDDDEIFRKILAFSLRRSNHQIVEASNGKDAFELLQKNKFDLVISDIQMPCGGGIELVERMKEDRMHTPIILMMTGFGEISTEEALKNEVDAIFTKPFDLKTLEEAITSIFVPVSERKNQGHIDAGDEVLVELCFQDSVLSVCMIGFEEQRMMIGLNKGQFLQVNDQISFSLKVRDRFELKGCGIVRWIRPKHTLQFPLGCGVEFTNLGEAEKQQILNYLADQKLRF